MKASKQLKAARESQALERIDENQSLGYSLNLDFEAPPEVDRNLGEYLNIILKYWWLVIGITLLSTTLVTVYVARRPDTYGATARIQVDLENSQYLSGKDGNPVVVSGATGDPDYFNTQIHILTGPGLLRRVVKTLDLENSQDFRRPFNGKNASTWQSVKRVFGFGTPLQQDLPAVTAENVLLRTPIAPATAREDLAEAKRLEPYVGAIQGNLAVDQVRNTRLIEITFIHGDAQVAAKVANTIGDTFVLSNLEKMKDSNDTAAVFFQERIADLREKIKTGEERLNNFAKNNQLVSIDPNQNTTADRLTTLNKQLLDAQNERTLAEAAYRAALSPGAIDAMADSNNPQATQLESHIISLRTQMAQLLVENTEELPEVRQIKQQIIVLEQQLSESRERSRKNALTTLETRYKQALQREQSLSASFKQQRSESLDQNESGINLRMLQQEITTNRTLLDSLLQRYKENEVVIAGMPNNIRVTDYALAPSSPIGTTRIQAIGLAFVISLAFGLGLAALIGYLDDTIRTAEEAERVLLLPALAVVPKIKSDSKIRLLPTSSTALQLRNGSGNGRPLLKGEQKRSPLMEIYRKLRTSMLLATPGSRPRTILVTSSVPAEGKSTTVFNTALTLSQSNSPVLIVDADLRHPCVHSMFDMDNELGLGTILAGEMDEAEILNLIKQDTATGLYVLTAGPEMSNPAELLGSDQMRRLLDVLGRNFNHVIIDAPPLVCFTDAAILSSMVDGVLIVIQSGKVSRKIALYSLRALQSVGAEILGVVLNQADVKTNNSYYNYYYDTAARA